MNPTLPAIGTEHEPVDPTALQQLDFVALVEDADFGRSELVRRVQQPNQPVTDLAALIVIERADAGGLERKVGRLLSHGPHRIRSTYLLQRRSAPARQRRFVDDTQPGSSLSLKSARGGLGHKLVVWFVFVAAPLAEEREGGPR